MANQHSTAVVVISRSEAIEKGLKYYFTGKPCSRKGVAPRRVSDRKCTCTACTANERKKSRATVISKKAAGLYRYPYKYRHLSEQAKEARATARKARYLDRKDEVIAKVRDWQRKNADRLKLAYWSQADVRRDYQSRYRVDNRGKVQEARSKRRKAQAQRTPIWYSEFDEFVVSEAARLAFDRAIATGIVWHTDHQIALMGRAACGLHCGANIQVIPAWLNLAKGNSTRLSEPDQWLACM